MKIMSLVATPTETDVLADIARERAAGLDPFGDDEFDPPVIGAKEVIEDPDEVVLRLPMPHQKRMPPRHRTRRSKVRRAVMLSPMRKMMHRRSLLRMQMRMRRRLKSPTPRPQSRSRKPPKRRPSPRFQPTRRNCRRITRSSVVCF
jgi:hypothetical protein